MALPVQIQSSIYDDNMKWLYHQKLHTDVIFVVGSIGFPAHKFVLAAGSPIFHRLFMSEIETVGSETGETSSESNLVSTA